MCIFRSFLQENEKNYRELMISVKLISNSQKQDGNKTEWQS
jgi:hypothetical protein